MSIASQLPTMTDGELATLHENTKRLTNAGTVAQKTAAVALMPSITTELAVRSDAAAARKAEAVSLRRASKVKPDAAVAG
jgi:hypothetical protein